MKRKTRKNTINNIISTSATAERPVFIKNKQKYFCNNWCINVPSFREPVQQDLLALRHFSNHVSNSALIHTLNVTRVFSASDVISLYCSVKLSQIRRYFPQWKRCFSPWYAAVNICNTHTRSRLELSITDWHRIEISYIVWNIYYVSRRVVL